MFRGNTTCKPLTETGVISSIILVHGVYIKLRVHNYGHGQSSRQLSTKGGHSATQTEVKQSIHIKGEMSPKLTHKNKQ